MADGNYLNALKRQELAAEQYLTNIEAKRMNCLGKQSVEGNIEALRYENLRFTKETELRALQEKIKNEENRIVYEPHEEEAYQNNQISTEYATAQTRYENMAKRTDGVYKDLQKSNETAIKTGYDGAKAEARYQDQEYSMVKDEFSYRGDCVHIYESAMTKEQVENVDIKAVNTNEKSIENEVKKECDNSFEM